MESKKGQQMSPHSVKKAFRRFEDVKSEFFRIEWLEGGDIKGYTKIVILAILMCGMLLYIADLFVQGALFGINTILRMIFG